MPGEQQILIVTYIASTPATLWDALTNPNVTQRYWFQTRIESDWEVGSQVLYRRDGQITDEHTLLTFEPFSLLSYTFHPLYDAFRGERPSRVTFAIVPGGEVVKLTMTHDHFEPNSKVYAACVDGWPMILSNLKTFLETGNALPAFQLPPQLEQLRVS